MLIIKYENRVVYTLSELCERYPMKVINIICKTFIVYIINLIKWIKEIKTFDDCVYYR